MLKPCFCGVLASVGLAALVITACSPEGSDAALRTYLERLARPLNATNVEPVEPSLPIPPRAEALQIPVEAGRLDGLDFLRLRGCALQDVVARRNSSLGRVAPPSQRLLLELAFLREAPDCVDTLLAEDRRELAYLIRESMLLKKNQLPALIFNATLGNREYRDFWRQSQTDDDYPAQTSSLVITALEQVSADSARWLAGDYTAEGDRLELALAEIGRGDGGELLSALARQASYLEVANNMINSSLETGPVCTAGRRPDAAAILRTVAKKFFLSGVQPRAAALNQRYHGLMPAIGALENQLSAVLPAPYLEWRNARSTALSDGLAALPEHVNQLQSLLGSCYREFAPGALPAGQ